MNFCCIKSKRRWIMLDEGFDKSKYDQYLNDSKLLNSFFILEIQKKKFNDAKERVEIMNARTLRHQENYEHVLAKNSAENMVLRVYFGT